LANVRAEFALLVTVFKLRTLWRAWRCRWRPSPGELTVTVGAGQSGGAPHAFERIIGMCLRRSEGAWLSGGSQAQAQVHGAFSVYGRQVKNPNAPV